MGLLDMVVRRPRRRRRRTKRVYPDRLHVFEFVHTAPGSWPRREVVLVRGKMGQIAAIDEAWTTARRSGGDRRLESIATVHPPRATPKLDALCARWTAFRTFLDLLTAPGGYTPSIRLDLMGHDGLVLAGAYDRRQEAWGDPRRACVWRETPRHPDARHRLPVAAPATSAEA